MLNDIVDGVLDIKGWRIQMAALEFPGNLLLRLAWRRSGVRLNQFSENHASIGLNWMFFGFSRFSACLLRTDLDGPCQPLPHGGSSTWQERSIGLRTPVSLVYAYSSY